MTVLNRVAHITFLLLTNILILSPSRAQNNIIVGSEDESIYRDRVLKNDIESKSSFTVRPIMASIQDTSLQTGRYFYVIPQLKNIVKQKYFTINALPLSHETQYHPQSYGFRNNGAFVSVKGMQQQLSTGIELSSKILDLRVSPELLWISNHKECQTQSLHVLGGQSMLRLKAGKLMAISAGTEQLWWGPAVFNSLMMSNNAPGFPHLSLHSYKPIELPIGTIEFNIVGGQLKNTRGFPMENFNQAPIESALPGNEMFKRFFSGFNFAYQPVFMPGFSVGINRMLQYYTFDRDSQGDFVQQFLPVITPIFKNKAGGNNGLDEDARNRDQLINIFARYMFKEYQLEVYGEFGWNDHKYNIRDLVSNPDHAAAYNIGIRKIIPSGKNEFFTLAAEVTQMAPTNSEIGRGAGNWYVHGGVREGYTHHGQIMGGGVAPGDNTATLGISRTAQFSKQSITIERYQHDPQFNAVKWTDWSIGLKHMQHLGAFTLMGNVNLIKSRQFMFKDQNIFHVHPVLKILYHWH
jgi:hypothetical protein